MGLEKIGKEKRCQEKINQEMTRSTAVTGSTGMIVWANDTPLHPTPPPVQRVCLQMYVWNSRFASASEIQWTLTSQPHPTPTFVWIKKVCESQASVFPSRKWYLGDVSDSETQVSSFPSRKWSIFHPKWYKFIFGFTTLYTWYQ